jgi:hypothetical protein
MRIVLSSSSVVSVVLAASAVAGLPSAVRAGSVSYTVSVDSTGISGTSGYLETMLATSAPPTTGFPTVTATFSSAVTDGTLGAVNYSTGDVSGASNNTLLTLANDNSSSSNLSDLQLGFTYGTSLSFELTLSGTEVNSGNTVFPFSGTVLSFILEDGSQNGLNSGPLFPGEAFDIYVTPSGGLLSVSPNDPYVASGPVAGYAPASGSDPTVTIAPYTGSVSEPSSIVPMGLGLGAMVAISLWRRNAA